MSSPLTVSCTASRPRGAVSVTENRYVNVSVAPPAIVVDVADRVPTKKLSDAVSLPLPSYTNTSVSAVTVQEFSPTLATVTMTCTLSDPLCPRVTESGVMETASTVSSAAAYTRHTNESLSPASLSLPSAMNVLNFVSTPSKYAVIVSNPVSAPVLMMT